MIYKEQKRKRIENIRCKFLALVYAFSMMYNNQLSPEDYSLLVEASADERQMQNFFSPDVEESEEDEEDWESQPVSSEEAEVYYERQMESWMDGRGEE